MSLLLDSTTVETKILNRKV